MVRIWETFTTLARGSPASIAVPDDLLAAVDRAGAEATVVKTSYLAIPVEQVARLMQTVGFENIGRVDGRFFQPVLVGSRPVV